MCKVGLANGPFFWPGRGGSPISRNLVRVPGLGLSPNSGHVRGQVLSGVLGSCGLEGTPNLDKPEGDAVCRAEEGELGTGKGRKLVSFG